MDTAPIPLLDMSTPASKQAAYRVLSAQAAALCGAQRVWFTNLSQFAALVFHSVPGLNWAGFYVVRGEDLVLGPFQGKVACTRIPFAQGVCGACARSREVQIVPDVEAFPGHIACDSASRSELVLPVLVDGRLAAVFDLDSPQLARFDDIDAQGLADALQALIAATDWRELRS
jgi:L-methionine (R)-S-oxide reductase